METLEAGDALVTIDHDHGGRLSAFSIAGHELLVSEADGLPGDTGWGSFPMIPFAGRIRRGRFHHGRRAVTLPCDLPPHAIHGTTYTVPWEQTGPGRLRTALGDTWPWPGTAHQEVDLATDSLTLRIIVETGGDESMPLTAGWHPWFRRTLGDRPVEISLPARAMWRRDAEGIPDGTTVDPPPGPWDDCFTGLTWPVTLRWPGLLSLAISADVDHVVVYDEQDHAVCIEPQSAPPDAHNSGHGLAEVTRDAPFAIETRWTWAMEASRPV